MSKPSRICFFKILRFRDNRIVKRYRLILVLLPRKWVSAKRADRFFRVLSRRFGSIDEIFWLCSKYVNHLKRVHTSHLILIFWFGIQLSSQIWGCFSHAFLLILYFHVLNTVSPFTLLHRSRRRHTLKPGHWIIALITYGCIGLFRPLLEQELSRYWTIILLGVVKVSHRNRAIFLIILVASFGCVQRDLVSIQKFEPVFVRKLTWQADGTIGNGTIIHLEWI